MNKSGSNNETCYALFNNPAGNLTEQQVILKDLQALINGAPAGSQINGAIYSFTRDWLRDALVNAVKRGVAVQLVMDGNKEESMKEFLNPLETALKGGTNCSFLPCGKDETCGKDKNGACISDASGGKQHSKYWLFSKSVHPIHRTIENAVFVTSSNLTWPAMVSQYNDAFVSWGDSYWYDHWLAHWKLQNEEKHFPNNNYYAPSAGRGYFQSPTTYYTAFFSPNGTGQGDIWHYRLREGRLPGDGEQQDSDAYLYINQAWFTDPRQIVADDVVQIAKGGATVKVIVNNAEVGKEIRKKIENQQNLEVKYLPHPSESEDTTHHKYMVYCGKYDGVSGRQRVWLGSDNLTKPANFCNDEVIVKVGDPVIANLYASDFLKLWEIASSL